MRNNKSGSENNVSEFYFYNDSVLSLTDLPIDKEKLRLLNSDNTETIDGTVKLTYVDGIGYWKISCPGLGTPDVFIRLNSIMIDIFADSLERKELPEVLGYVNGVYVLKSLKRKFLAFVDIKGNSIVIPRLTDIQHKSVKLDGNILLTHSFKSDGESDDADIRCLDLSELFLNVKFKPSSAFLTIGGDSYFSRQPELLRKTINSVNASNGINKLSALEDSIVKLNFENDAALIDGKYYKKKFLKF